MRSRPLGQRRSVPRFDRGPFTDAHGHRWSLFDKPPIFGSSIELTPDAPYPVATELDCTILTIDQNLATISTLTPWGVSTEDDISEFTVFTWQLTPTTP